MEGSGSQCAEESFPPVESRSAPKYTEDSPPSGMAMAWQPDDPGEITALTDGAIAAIVITVIVVRLGGVGMPLEMVSEPGMLTTIAAVCMPGAYSRSVTCVLPGHKEKHWKKHSCAGAY